METLLTHLLRLAEKCPCRTALRCGAREVSFGDLRSLIRSAAARLRELRVAKGDRVLISTADTVAIPVLYFAVHAIGAVAVPLPPETPESVFAILATDAAARLAIIEKPISEIPCAVVSPATLATDPTDGEDIEPVGSADTVADLLYTTGTTGHKKGVVLTQANILAAARNISSFIGNTIDDVEVVPLPLSHSFGLGRLRCMALIGNTLVLEPGLGSGARMLKRILDLRATGLALVPAGFEILRRVTGDVLGNAREHLRYIEIGSAPMRPETRQWLTDLLPRTRICHHYGLTEASRAVFTEYHNDISKPGTIGRAAPNVEITICDEEGRRVPTGEPGEIVVRGAMVMREYWNQSELTQRAFCAEGLRTGDIGYMDGDGYLFLLGRRSDLINVGGRKIAPDEIEELLCQIEGVRDAGCVGEPDELVGQTIKAYVVADRAIEQAEVVSFLRARVEEFKIPQSVQRIERVPRTESGKIQRQMLRMLKESAWTSDR